MEVLIVARPKSTKSKCPKVRNREGLNAKADYFFLNYLCKISPAPYKEF